jgi:hypothetical protein
MIATHNGIFLIFTTPQAHAGEQRFFQQTASQHVAFPASGNRLWGEPGMFQQVGYQRLLNLRNTFYATIDLGPSPTSTFAKIESTVKLTSKS